MERHCIHHADRAAHAVCMTCGRSLCLECATTWEGIHYCARCLSLKGRVARASSPWGMWAVLALAVAGLCWLHAQLVVWVGVMAAGFRQ